MSLVDDIVEKACQLDACIAYPEPDDERIVEAAGEVAEKGIAEPILVGHSSDLPADVPSGVTVERIEESSRVPDFAERYAERRDVSPKVAKRLLRRPLIYASMMVERGLADGMVAGAAHTTANVLSAAGLAIGYDERVSGPSSYMIMLISRAGEAEDLPLIFADCAVNIDPTPRELAEMVLLSGGQARRLLNEVPRVAMLSFSTAGSATHPLVDKVKEAVRLAQDMVEDGYVEGEMQLDAAVNPAVAARKVGPDSEVAGRANVLIFPDLNAGNITYKATQYLGGAQALGPMLQGFARPVNDLSRGASVDDIVLTTAVTVIQAGGNG